MIPKSIHNERILENSLVFDFNIESEDIDSTDSFFELAQIESKIWRIIGVVGNIGS